MEQTNTNKLNRNIGLFAAIAMMTGMVVGASVFIVPGELSASTGPTAWLSYLIGAILIGFSCFVFAQVGSVLPVSGANYMLCTGTVNGTWGFMYVWAFLIGNVFLFSIMSRTVATYLAVLFPALAEHTTLVAVLVILFTCSISLFGNQIFTRIQNVCVILLIAVILIFSTGGVANANWSHFDPMFPNGFTPVILGVISTYYAFAGMNGIIELSGEIKNPGKNIPRTVFISFAIVIVMYVGMCVGLVGLVPADELGVAAPTIMAAELIFPSWFSSLVAIAAVAASWTTLNGVCAGMARILLVLGKSNILPKSYGKINRHNAPQLPIITLMIIGVIMTLFSTTIMQFVNISSFYLLLMALLVAVGSLKIKTAFASQYEASEYKLKGVWYYVWPVLVIVSSAVFMVLQFISDPLWTGASVVLIPVAVGFYYIRKRKLEAATGINLDKQILDGMNE